MVRLENAEVMGTPKLATYRFLYLYASPFIALWASGRTLLNPQTFKKCWHTLPLVYLTKLAWCWGAYINFPKSI